MSEEKKQKRKFLIEQGLNPYPYNFKRTIHTSDVLGARLSEGQEGALSGRLMRMRNMGQAAFFNVQDMRGQCQCYLKSKELSSEDQLFFKSVDIGDIVGVKGSFFKTKKGENTLRVSSFQILCKSTELLPEKYHGLEDKELRYRRRYLDLIMNQKARQTLITRSRVIQFLRDFMIKKEFIEVEAPTLQPLYGGAMAEPFSTKHRAFDAKFYLKISPELYLKRLIAGGIEKVFEIGKNFRNEGMDRLHNPEFTMMEYYESYTDYNDQMKTFEEMIASTVKAVKGEAEISYQGQALNFTPPWLRVSFFDAIEKWGGFDARKIEAKGLVRKLESVGVTADISEGKDKLIETVFENFVEKKITHPVFIIDFPKNMSPLTKKHRSIEGLSERFEVFVMGMEIANAYTELNDPVDQRQRLEGQNRVKDNQTHPVDEDFLHAVGVGMPPLGGVGIGIDRLVMLLTNQPSIREVVWFPMSKPKLK